MSSAQLRCLLSGLCSRRVSVVQASTVVLLLMVRFSVVVMMCAAGFARSVAIPRVEGRSF